MSKHDDNIQIISQIAKGIEQSTVAKSDSDAAKSPSQSDEPQLNVTPNNGDTQKKKRGTRKGGSQLTVAQLTAKRKNQILAERKALLIILGVLFGLQLLFMNALVMLIVLWCVFDWSVFREIDADILDNILNFSKYYVTAVLVELLGGIIYIVHSVFSDKD